jgi:translocation protein SEC66
MYSQLLLAKASSLAPWFGPHLQRNIYLSLLHTESGTKIPESQLKAALLRRATEDIHRIVAIRQQKPALTQLLQRGSVGDELWQRFLRAEKEIEEELKDVVNEANGFQPGWGQIIFQTANEIANNQMARKRMEELQSQVDAEKEWWEKKKAITREEFMKELETEKPTASTSKGSDDDGVLVEAGGPAAAQQTGKKKKKGKH